VKADPLALNGGANCLFRLQGRAAHKPTGGARNPAVAN
jgi:hypothetical protein